MAFLTGAIDKKNLRRFKTLIATSQIAELYQRPYKQEGYYVVDLRISMDPETIIRVLDLYDTKTHLGSKTR
jgi:hypothetical protein